MKLYDHAWRGTIVLALALGSLVAQAQSKARTGVAEAVQRRDDVYLYVRGSLGVAWSVDGYGPGMNSVTQSITILHNRPFSVAFDGFDDLHKENFDTSGTQSVPMWLQFRGFAGSSMLLETPLAPAESYNGPLASGRVFLPGDTGGSLRLDLTRLITIDPGVGPGYYRNDGRVTITRF